MIVQLDYVKECGRPLIVNKAKLNNIKNINKSGTNHPELLGLINLHFEVYSLFVSIYHRSDLASYVPLFIHLYIVR